MSGVDTCKIAGISRRINDVVDIQKDYIVILGLLGICCGFPFFGFQPLKTKHSVHTRTESLMTPQDGATI